MLHKREPTVAISNPDGNAIIDPADQTDRLGRQLLHRASPVRRAPGATPGTPRRLPARGPRDGQSLGAFGSPLDCAAVCREVGVAANGRPSPR